MAPTFPGQNWIQIPLFPGNRLIGGRPFRSRCFGNDDRQSRRIRGVTGWEFKRIRDSRRPVCNSAKNDKEDDRSVRLTRSSARERDAIWLSEHAVLFVSDEDGQNDLYIIESADEERRAFTRPSKQKPDALRKRPKRNSSLFSPLMANA